MRTGIPDVQLRQGVMHFEAEKYSDHAAVLAADEEHLIPILLEQDAAAPKYRVRHVPSKEEYLYMDFKDPEKPGALEIKEGECKPAKRKTLKQGIGVLGNQVSRHALGVHLRAKARGVIAPWARAVGYRTQVWEAATLHSEQMDGQLQSRCGGVVLAEGEIHKIAAAAGRSWRRSLKMDFKVDSSTLWDVLDRAFGGQHPRTIVYQTAVWARVRTINNSRADLALWAVERWHQSGQQSTETEVLGELGMVITDVTVELREHESRQKIEFPWEEWKRLAQGQQVAVYGDASTGEHAINKQWLQGAGVGRFVQIDKEWWTLSVPLPAEYDNTSGEMIRLALAKRVAKELLAEANSGAIVYDAQAAAPILEASGHKQRHPVRKAVHAAAPECQPIDWWVKSHQEKKEEGTSSKPAGPHTDKARRVHGNERPRREPCRMRAAGKRVALPLAIEPAYRVALRKGGPERSVLQWRIHPPEHRREPGGLHPRIPGLLREFPDGILTVVPLHLDVWPPGLKACGRCPRKEVATTRFRCPCFRGQ